MTSSASIPGSQACGWERHRLEVLHDKLQSQDFLGLEENMVQAMTGYHLHNGDTSADGFPPSPPFPVCNGKREERSTAERGESEWTCFSNMPAMMVYLEQTISMLSLGAGGVT